MLAWNPWSEIGKRFIEAFHGQEILANIDTRRKLVTREVKMSITISWFVRSRRFLFVMITSDVLGQKDLPTMRNEAIIRRVPR